MAWPPEEHRKDDDCHSLPWQSERVLHGRGRTRHRNTGEKGPVPKPYVYSVWGPGFLGFDDSRQCTSIDWRNCSTRQLEYGRPRTSTVCLDWYPSGLGTLGSCITSDSIVSYINRSWWMLARMFLGHAGGRAWHPTEWRQGRHGRGRADMAVIKSDRRQFCQHGWIWTIHHLIITPWSANNIWSSIRITMRVSLVSLTLLYPDPSGSKESHDVVWGFKVGFSLWNHIRVPLWSGHWIHPAVKNITGSEVSGRCLIGHKGHQTPVDTISSVLPWNADDAPFLRLHNVTHICNQIGANEGNLGGASMCFQSFHDLPMQAAVSLDHFGPLFF